MNQKIADYVDFLFRNAPQTSEAMELREEIYSNINEKYNDLVQNGNSEEEAFTKAIANMGDVNEILSELKSTPMPAGISPQERDKKRKRSGLLIGIAVALYIMSVVPVIVFAELYDNEVIGIVIMFSLVAIATMILIYNGYANAKTDEDKTMVEDFKQYRYQNSRQAKINKEIDSIIWSIAVILFVVLSFWTGAWYITWVIFIIAAVVQKIVKLIMM